MRVIVIDPRRTETARRAAHQVTSARPYPYRLVNGRVVHTYNSNGQDLASLRRKLAYNPAFMHPDDLDREGLAAGDLVDIWSEHGAIRGIVQPDVDLRPDVILMTPTYGGLPEDQDRQVRE